MRTGALYRADDPVRSLGYASARVITKGNVHSLSLDEPTPEGWFDTSSDVLFFTSEPAKDARRIGGHRAAAEHLGRVPAGHAPRV